MTWMLMPLRKYAQFAGRSQRKEYWMYVLLMVIVATILAGFGVALSIGRNGVDAVGSPDPFVRMAGMRPLLWLLGLFYLAVLLPTIAVSVRRLHDIDRTGWWILASFAPTVLRWALVLAGTTSTALFLVLGLVGLAAQITLLVFYCTDGTRGPNRFGDDPKGHDLAATFA